MNIKSIKRHNLLKNQLISIILVRKIIKDHTHDLDLTQDVDPNQEIEEDLKTEKDLEIIKNQKIEGEDPIQDKRIIVKETKEETYLVAQVVHLADLVLVQARALVSVVDLINYC